MADCVDREKLIHDIVNIPSKVCEEQHQPLLLTGAAFRQKEILDLIEGATLVYAEPVVKCRDCEGADWSQKSDLYHTVYCLKHCRRFDLDFYCAYGERTVGV